MDWYPTNTDKPRSTKASGIDRCQPPNLFMTETDGRIECEVETWDRHKDLSKIEHASGFPVLIISIIHLWKNLSRIEIRDPFVLRCLA